MTSGSDNSRPPTRRSGAWFSETRPGGDDALCARVERHVCTVEGPLQRIDIFDTPSFGRVFTLDGLVMVTERDEWMYHEMLVHVPLFSHPDPRRVLIIGGGDGGSLREVLRHPGVEEAVLVEIDGNVVEAARAHLPFTAKAMDDPRATVLVEEGAAYVKARRARFDAIIIDSTDPFKGAGGLLFTEEFYAGCRAALRDGGVLSAETEDVFYDAEWWTKASARLANVFRVSRAYWGSVTTYPSGAWTYAFASDTVDPVRDLRREDARRMAQALRYYDDEIHAACFALPRFMKQALSASR